jgi:1,4-dihydroxy-2-naphthoate octaprenyltransferase
MEDYMDRRKKPANEGAAVKGFLVLSRLPFLSPGVAALVTGIVIALSEGYDPSEGLVWMSTLGLVLIMLATYYFNEYFDYEGDIINKTFIKFSGGSRALPDNMVPRPVARIAGYSSVAVLVAIAVVYMLFYFEDYPLLLPLALFGAFCGVFYTHPPFQWAYQGIGEIVIGGCYGILTFVSGFYLVSGVLNLNMLLVGLPASLTIFLVILANEFPDYEADKAVNKRNLIVRLGPQKGVLLYAGVMMSVYPAMLATVAVDIDPWIAVAGLPTLALAIVATAMALKGGFGSPSAQTKISGLTLLANLLSSLMFIPVVLIW